jgi:hypothetical protein
VVLPAVTVPVLAFYSARCRLSRVALANRCRPRRSRFARRLQRNIVVLLPRIAQLLVAQHGEGAAESPAGAVRHDHVVDESPAAGDEGVGEFLAVLLGARLDLVGVAQVAAISAEGQAKLTPLPRCFELMTS